MKSTKPYLFEAMYQWMIDSDCTPLVSARTDVLGVNVPEGFSKNNQIVLDIGIDSIEDLTITEHLITFSASFSGIVHKIRLPMIAVLAIHTAENGMGIEFQEEEGEIDPTEISGQPDLRVL